MTEYTARVRNYGTVIDEFTTTRLAELRDHYIKWYLAKEAGLVQYEVYKDGRLCGISCDRGIQKISKED